MIKRTFKVVQKKCTDCKKCTITGISRDDLYQSLKDAKLYYLMDNGSCPPFLALVEEERE